MAEPLPAGWIDTGITGSFAVSVGLQIRYAESAGDGPEFYIGSPVYGIEWRLWAEVNHAAAIGQCPGGTDGVFVNDAIRVSAGALGTTELEAITGVRCEGALIESDVYQFSETITGLRLGVGLAYTGGQNDAPRFARGYQLEYRWFADENTTLVASLGPVSSGTYYWQEGGFFDPIQASPFTPSPLSAASRLSHVGFGGNHSRARGWTINGAAVDTSELDDGVALGLGDRDIDFAPSGGTTLFCGPSYLLTEHLETTAYGGGPLSAVILDPDGREYLSPHAGERVHQTLSWPNSQPPFNPVRSYAIKSDWAAAQDPPLPSDDLQLPVIIAPPFLEPETQYRPLQIRFSPEQNLDRPGRVPEPVYPPPAFWVSSDSNKLAITHAAHSDVMETDVTFDCLQTGATATRQLVSAWRDRVGLGTGGTGHADFDIDGYTWTRHEDDEDLWSWQERGYLRLDMEAPQASELLLTVKGVWLQVDDPHTTGSHRIANYSAAAVPFERSYTIPLAAGANTRYVDLLFPDEGGPFYYGRVDEIALSGFETGTYQMTRLTLVALGEVHFKCLWGKQVQRSDYSMLHAACDGAPMFANLPDRMIKEDETGEYGGGLRYVNIVTGSESGLVLDTQLSLPDFWAQLARIEGWTADYSQAKEDAALKDAFGNSLGPGLAQWTLPIPGTWFPAGEHYEPECAIVAGSVRIVPGRAFTVNARLPLWGGLEALATLGGERAPAGRAVGAVREETGEVVAAGSTDAHGYVVVRPVPANGDARYFLSEI
jgi:hypothetical protein